MGCRGTLREQGWAETSRFAAFRGPSTQSLIFRAFQRILEQSFRNPLSRWAGVFVAIHFRIFAAVLALLWMGLSLPAQEPKGGPGAPGSPPNPGQPNGEAKEGEKKEEGKEDPPPKVIRRDEVKSTDKPSEPLTAKVDTDGKVSFQFRDQGWVELVQWLADISDQPIDWLELPGDKVNLRSPGKYTVLETQDLFNRHLLARGYTLLEVDGGLTIVKTKTINPAIVQRVDEDELKKLPDYTFVRSTLDAGWLSAAKLAEEFKPMLSSGGVLTALATTNQIEAMDAAINLREIAHLIATQRSKTTLETLAPEFKLHHLPAEKAKTMLEDFLGISKKDTPVLTPEQIQQMQQRGGGQPDMSALAPKTPEISVVANIRQNSLLIRAPVDRIAVSMEFLKRVDVASNSMASLADIKTSVQVFRLASLDPEKLIEIVNEMNFLEPDTRIRSDKDNKAVIVSGSAADRFIIENLIQRLDGSGRTFEVLPLRRLDPTAVAESIAFLMGNGEKKDENKNSRRSYYWGYDNEEEEKKDEDQFRVSANAPGRQIMLWANEQEMEQVRSLLIKLGELPPPGGNQQTTRVIDASATPETLLYLQRLKSQWQQIASNELELPSEDQFVDPNDKQEETEDKEPSADAPTEEKDTKAKEDDVDAKDAAVNWPAPSGPESTTQFTLVNQLGDDEQEDSGDNAPPLDQDKIRSSKDFDRVFGTGKKEEPASAKSDGTDPITVQIDADGNLVLSSKDTEALDRLENLMLQIAPPRRAYRVFHMKHASAFWMKTNLEDYFKDNEDDGKSQADSFFSWYWDDEEEDEEEKPTGLGKGNKLKFVDDVDTNTLVVSGATSSQLKTIEELIELWDVDEPVNKQRARFTELTTIKFGKAETIAETVKEAYRDLLSSNDKTFQAGGAGGEGGGESKPKKNKNASEGSSFESGDRDGGATDFAFKGKLSMGVDPVGNTILVSAEGESLLGLVIDMIEQLDKAAAPKGEVEVIEVSGKINEEALQNALKMMGQTSGASSKPASIENGQPRGDRSERSRSRDR
jgi:type II secretory pathway component GspD/PulD (secretin)